METGLNHESKGMVVNRQALEELMASLGYELPPSIFDQDKELVKALRAETEGRAKMEADLRTARGFLKEAQDSLKKCQEQNLRLERDLARSLGYIDRVVELETPPPEPVLVQEQRRSVPRGPRLAESADLIPDSFYRR